MTLSDCIEAVALPWIYNAPLFLIQLLFLIFLSVKESKKRDWGKSKAAIDHFSRFLTVLLWIQIAVDVYRIATLVPDIDGGWNRYQCLAAVLIFSPNFRVFACWMFGYIWVAANDFSIEGVHRKIKSMVMDCRSESEICSDGFYADDRISCKSFGYIYSFVLYMVLLLPTLVTHMIPAIAVYCWFVALFPLFCVGVGMMCLFLFACVTWPCSCVKCSDLEEGGTM